MQKKRNNKQTESLTSKQLVKKADFEHPKISLFDCGDDDLNEFIKQDAWPHKENLLAETYLFYPTDLYESGVFKPVAFASVCNDAITMEYVERKGEKKTFFKTAIQKKLPQKKRFRKSYPAVKVARLAVSKDYQCGGIGSHILNMIKELFLTENRTGCRFITVDAYNNPRTLDFYKKNGFDFLIDEEQKAKKSPEGKSNSVLKSPRYRSLRRLFDYHHARFGRTFRGNVMKTKWNKKSQNIQHDKTKIMYFDLSTYVENDGA